MARLREARLELTVRGDTLLVQPREKLTDELRALIRDNKATILKALAAEARERRRRQALALLIPPRRFAAVADPPCEGVVPITVAVRTAEGAFTGELTAPAEHWNPALFLSYLQELDAGKPS